MININNEIKKKIEILRNNMVETGIKHDNMNHPEVVKLSQRLDELLNLYSEISDMELLFYN